MAVSITALTRIVSVIKKCKACGKEFEPNKHNQIYCSKECKKEVHRNYSRQHYIKKPKLKRTCRYCGKVFETKTNSRFYCSKECADKAQIERQRKYYRDNREKISARNKERYRNPKPKIIYPCNNLSYQDIPIEMCLNCKLERCKHDLLDRERQRT